MKVHHLLGARRIAGVLSVLLLSACSSDSGGDGAEGRATWTQVSANSISFAVDGPDAETPASETITATFGENVAHLAVVHTGTGLADVTSTVAGRTAEITIVPQSPDALGSGVFRGAIAVTGYFCADAACTSLAAGNTQQIAVTYQISPILLTVSPYVGIANVESTAIIRGVGFGSFAVRGVRFNDTPATDFAVFSDQEIRATYPALPAGTYEVQLELTGHEGDIQSQASLVIVEPTTYTAQTLAYPTAGTVRELLYDQERRAILVATDAGGGTLLRYAYDGAAWSAPASASLNDVQDIALSTRGDRLLAITRTALVPFDPASLAAGTSIDAPSLPEGVTLRGLGVINDDRALITTGRAESQASGLYLYTGRTSTLSALNTGLNNATPAAALTGSSIVFVQGISSTTNAPPVVLFSASSGQFDATPANLTQNAVPPAIDRVGTRALLNGTNVYGPGFALFGTLPTGAVAATLKPDGTRAYTYDPNAGGIRVFNVSETRNGEAYSAIGNPVPLVGDPGANPRMTISLDGNTLFIAGSTRLIVQPTPAE
jgi:hypothetical protein